MIFDSKELLELQEKSEGKANYEVPEIILMDRIEEFKNERIMLESLFSQVRIEKQKDWLARLLNDKDEQFIGAWFEIRLFGWLTEHFRVEVEPVINGCCPDFSIENMESRVIIEARAHIIPPEERARQQNLSRIFTFLGCIEKPYSAHFSVDQLGTTVNKEYLLEEVSGWLNTQNQTLLYMDDYGNVLEFNDKRETKLEHFSPWCSSAFTVQPEVLRPALREKHINTNQYAMQDSRM